MGDNSRIEWTDATWNPIIGCSRCSPGCWNCYAERMAVRQTYMRPGCEYEQVTSVAQNRDIPWKTRAGWNDRTVVVEKQLDVPLHWRKPRRVFVCSMGDLFHESVATPDIDRVRDVILRCPQHTFLLLTKRPGKMGTYTRMGRPWPDNVWLGVTVCNQAEANEKIPMLLATPGAKHFVSVEPMLGPVDLTTVIGPDNEAIDVLNGVIRPEGGDWLPSSLMLDWVICGGETGPFARPMHPCWARELRDQCVAENVPFFFKQLGEWGQVRWQGCRTNAGDVICCPGGKMVYVITPGQMAGNMDGVSLLRRVGKHVAGRLLDGREWNEMPTVEVAG